MTDDDARRCYLTNIVGKYGPRMYEALHKPCRHSRQDQIYLPASRAGLARGPDVFYRKYDLWSRYAGGKGVGDRLRVNVRSNTESAAQALAARLCDKGTTTAAR